MRLTLRTLLAYLDDTLEPGEIKHIGQKVAESDAAQELIARIKQITRQRRLTTPPLTGPGAKFDANTVAEYLDNELPSEQVSELEKTCLESDVHLAEIASSHQILTLVLGEPALVPPTAKERMYQLVHGREANPYRKAPAPVSTSIDSPHELEPDESPLLGLSFFRKPSLIRWILPVAAVLLVAALGIAIWMALPPDSKPKDDQVAGLSEKEKADKEKADKEKADKEKADKERADKEQAEKERADKEKAEKEKAEKEKAEKEAMEKKNPMPDPVLKADPPSRIGKRAPPPRTDRLVVGSYQEPDRLPSMLLSRPRPPSPGAFKRLLPGAAIYSNETLVNLPGCTTSIELKTGVALTMRGNVHEFSAHPDMNLLLEVEVVIHAAAEGIDVDLTLDRGRLYFTNLKQGKDCVVRLRFHETVWDLTLKEGAEVGIELAKRYDTETNYLSQEPTTAVVLYVMQGRVEARFGSNPKIAKLEAPPGPAVLLWDSVTDQLPSATQLSDASLAVVQMIWSTQSPTAVLNKQRAALGELLQKVKPEQATELKIRIEELNSKVARTKAVLLALDEMSKLLTDKKPLDVWLEEGRASTSAEHRYVATYAMGALGELDKLLAVLGDEDPQHYPDRETGIIVLRRYVSRGLEASRVLYHENDSKKTGLLVERYGEKDGIKVFTLLHDFNPKDLTPDTFKLLTIYLKSNNLPVRQLAFWHLVQYSQNVKLPALALAYDPADPSRQRRDDSASEWQKLVEDGKLPPKQP